MFVVCKNCVINDSMWRGCEKMHIVFVGELHECSWHGCGMDIASAQCPNMW